MEPSVTQTDKIIREFKTQIRAELEECEPLETPHICANTAMEDGYRKIEALIIQRVLHEKITIGEAIISIENELSNLQ